MSKMLPFILRLVLDQGFITAAAAVILDHSVDELCCTNLPLTNLSLSSFLFDTIAEFSSSTAPSTFAVVGTPTKAIKRKRQHFRRTRHALIEELTLLLSGVRSSYLYDAGALTENGANALLTLLRIRSQQSLQQHLALAIQDLVVLTMGEDDVVFFVRRNATVRRLSNMLNHGTYCPALVDVSPKLDRPVLVDWSYHTKTNGLKNTMQNLLSLLQQTKAKSPSVKLESPYVLQQMTAIVGILLEYPVVYGMFKTVDDDDEDTHSGNCVAADTLCQRRLEWTPTTILSQLDNSPSILPPVLPWSFTVPKPLTRNIEVRRAIALFFVAVARRCRKSRGIGTLEWIIVEIDVPSVCL